MHVMAFFFKEKRQMLFFQFISQSVPEDPFTLHTSAIASKSNCHASRTDEGKYHPVVAELGFHVRVFHSKNFRRKYE